MANRTSSRFLRTAGSEAIRNLEAVSPGLIAAFACILAMAIASSGIEAAQALDAENRYRRFDETGGNILVVTATDTMLDTQTCLALRSADGVTAAAGVGDPTTAHVGAAGSVPARLVPGAGEIVFILDPASRSRGAGIAVGASLATELRLVPGTTTAIDGQPVKIATVFDPDERDPAWSGRLIVADPTLRKLRQCYIVFEPHARTAVVDTARGSFGRAGSEIRFLRFEGTRGSDAALLLQDRRTRSIGLMAGGASALIVAGVWILRRSSWATYRISGFGWTATTAVAWAEATMLSAVVTFIACQAVVAAVAVMHPPGSQAAVRLGLRSVTAAATVLLASTPLTAAIAVPRSIGTTLKETG